MNSQNEISTVGIVVKGSVIKGVLDAAKASGYSMKNNPEEYKKALLAVIEMESTKNNYAPGYIKLLVDAVNELEQSKLSYEDIPSMNIVDDEAGLPEFKILPEWHDSRHTAKYFMIAGSVLGTALVMLRDGINTKNVCTGAVMGGLSYVVGEKLSEYNGETTIDNVAVAAGRLGMLATSAAHYGVNRLLPVGDIEGEVEVLSPEQEIIDSNFKDNAVTIESTDTPAPPMFSSVLSFIF